LVEAIPGAIFSGSSFFGPWSYIIVASCFPFAFGPVPSAAPIARGPRLLHHCLCGPRPLTSAIARRLAQKPIRAAAFANSGPILRQMSPALEQEAHCNAAVSVFAMVKAHDRGEKF